VNGAIRERPGEGVVDQPVLLDEREAVEAVARDGDEEVVAPAGAVLDRDILARECLLEEATEPFDRRLSPSPST
jgi:hypothetical protein